MLSRAAAPLVLGRVDQTGSGGFDRLRVDCPGYVEITLVRGICTLNIAVV